MPLCGTTPAGDAIERGLGDGLRPRPARHRSKAAGADDRRYLLPVLTGAGAALHVPRRPRCRKESAGKRVPATTRVDQGTEFVSRDLHLWAYQRGVTLDFSRPEKPTDNAFIEASNGHFRAEYLNAHWFMSLADPAKVGGLAQVLQRGTPPRGNRPDDDDYAAESRWCSQPAIAKEPKNPIRRRSKVRPHALSADTLMAAG